MRGVKDFVAVAEMLLAPVLFDNRTNTCALRVPVHQTGADFVVNTEQVELGTELAVVAFFGLFELLKIELELLVVGEGRSVQALQHRVGFFATIVRAGDIQDFKRTNLPGAFEMRTAAEVEKVTALIEGNRFVFRNVGQTFEFVFLPDQHGLGFGAAHFDAFERKVFLHDLFHLMFDLFKIIRRDAIGQVKIVVKAVVDRWADVELNIIVNAADGGGHHMGRRVAERFNCNFIFHKSRRLYVCGVSVSIRAPLWLHFSNPWNFYRTLAFRSDRAGGRWFHPNDARGVGRSSPPRAER